MKSTFLPLLLLALCGAGLATAATPKAAKPAADQAAPALKVRKMGVQVIYEGWRNERMQGQEAGTTLWLQLTAPQGKQFIDTKTASRCRLKCQDGAGKPLEDAELNPFFNQIAEDGQTMVMELQTPSISPDNTLRVVGKVPVALSSGTDTLPPAALKLQEGASAKAGDYSLSVKEVEREDDSVTVTFGLKGKAAPAGISFTTTDGKELDADACGHMSTSFGGTINAEYSFTFGKDVQELKMLVSTWAAQENIEFPLKVKLSLGSPAKAKGKNKD